MTTTPGNDPVKDQAATEAANLKDTVKGEAADLGGTAKSEAKNVASEAKYQAKGMVDESVNQLRSQVSTGQNRIAEVVRSLATEASEMASASNQNGAISRLASDASRVGDDVASWLEGREPQDVLNEVRRFASRRPGLFLAVAAGAGLLAGRFVRGMKDDGQQGELQGRHGYDSQPRSLESGAIYSEDTYATREAYTGSQFAGSTYQQGQQYGQTSGQGVQSGQATTYGQADQYGQAPGYGQNTQYGQADQFGQTNPYGQSQAGDGTQDHLYSYSEDPHRSTNSDGQNWNNESGTTR